MTPSVPKLLVATTTWWPSVALLASALERAGFDIVVLCPRGHLANTAARYLSIVLDLDRSVASLAAAIRTVAPVMILAGDERTVVHLCQLYRSGNAELRALITRSVGPAECHDALTGRVPLLRAAQDAELPVPAFAPIETMADLERWMTRVPPPWVLKTDGAWGGEGVRIVQTAAAARRSFSHLKRGVSSGMAHKRALINGDPSWLHERRSGRVPVVSAQAFVQGRPGNCALFARDGEVQGATIVEAQTTHCGQGPATLVRVVDRPVFLEGACRLVRRLGLSGFIGLDFMIDQETDRAWLIEMNPRITAPCRIRGPFGLDPIRAAARSFACEARAPIETPRTLFASFPIAWLIDPFAPDLAACQGDVPWHEPDLLEEALKPLWPERGVASLPSHVRRWMTMLASGRRIVDYRSKPLTWWLARGVLRPPPLDSQHAGRQQDGSTASGFDPFAAHPA